MPSSAPAAAGSANVSASSAIDPRLIAVVFTAPEHFHAPERGFVRRSCGNHQRVPMRVLLATNPRARRGADARARAEAALQARGHTLTSIECTEDRDLSDQIAEYRGRVDVVAVGGGDGTLIRAIRGVRAAEVPLAILPLGTINELARTLRVPTDTEAACALIDDGTPHRIDVGCVNGFWFFNEASIGLSTHVAREQTGEVKSRWGMLAIPLATARSLRRMRAHHLEVETDAGEVRHFRTVQLTIANSSRFGGVVENPDASIDDGQLEVYSIDLRHWWDALAIVGAVALKRLPDAKGVRTLRGPRFTVRSRRPHQVFADGEPATSTPAEFSVLARAVAVFVPR
ncbi:MAG: lipid kinase [Candidatus Velthaea sp.]